MEEREPARRPDDYEDMVERAAAETVAQGELVDMEDAFQAGALWAALVFEGRLNG